MQLGGQRRTLAAPNANWGPGGLRSASWSQETNWAHLCVGGAGGSTGRGIAAQSGLLGVRSADLPHTICMYRRLPAL
jgi:hypothetical protein